MTKNLLKPAAVKSLNLILIVTLLLFVPAGTIYFVKAWYFIAIITFVGLGGFIYLLTYNPEIIERRLNISSRTTDKTESALIEAIIIIYLIIPGLDFRFGFTAVHEWLTISAAVCLICGLILSFRSMRVNRFASAAVEIIDCQTVVDTWPYSLIRHPMYQAEIIMVLSTPLVLGSYLMYLPAMFYIWIICRRIIHEEELLGGGLNGYREYMGRVKYRIIPGLW